MTASAPTKASKNEGIAMAKMHPETSAPQDFLAVIKTLEGFNEAQFSDIRVLVGMNSFGSSSAPLIHFIIHNSGLEPADIAFATQHILGFLNWSMVDPTLVSQLINTIVKQTTTSPDMIAVSDKITLELNKNFWLQNLQLTLLAAKQANMLLSSRLCPPVNAIG